MNILYLADPGLIHDLKWMRFFTKDHPCFVVSRAHHQAHLQSPQWKQFLAEENVEYLGQIEDFSIRHFIRSYREMNKLATWVKEHKIDLLHLFYAEPNALWAYFRKSLGVKMVLTSRGTDVLQTIPQFFQDEGWKNKLIRHFYGRAFGQLDQIVSTSLRQAESIEQHFPQVQKEIAIIRTGVDVEQFEEEQPQALPKALNEKQFVFFPRAMRPLYQHELAIAAIELLPKAVLEQYQFVFVNKDGKEQAYLKQIAQLMQNGQANYIWLPNLDQKALWQTYKSASLVVMTPKSDGTPVTAIEAMLSKTPLVLPPLAYDEDLFSGTCLQFKAWTADSLAQEIQKALEQPQTEMIEEAYLRAKGLANRTTEMARLGQIYGNLVPKG
ncbi:glycosyltransferase [Saprospira grandis DSM 2844]|uniref:Glycosyltransferase n=1 Tax=Saprospira grandis DSM 2844 TaxID=694433 RepID=J0Y082_9BACT|nr:glycosyltransferase family 4 protein [Saprospira grandis]EJF54926.1 glycosyltransferase [Saprospira grandis DSM 2844]